MAAKKSFALRIDADTMKALEKWAADEFRSVNGQIEWILHRALREAGRVRQQRGDAVDAPRAPDASRAPDAPRSPDARSPGE